MPNWCSNVLKVRGSKLALERLKKKAASKPNPDGPLSFASFIPEPKNTVTNCMSAILASDDGVSWHSPRDIFKKLGIPVEPGGNFRWGCDQLSELGWKVEVKDYNKDELGNITVLQRPDHRLRLPLQRMGHQVGRLRREPGREQRPDRPAHLRLQHRLEPT
jgi:hypothetical protein